MLPEAAYEDRDTNLGTGSAPSRKEERGGLYHSGCRCLLLKCSEMIR